MLKNAVKIGDQKKAIDIAKSFGTHLATVWKPLLEGSLPSGNFYLLADSAASNFIYTANPAPSKAFVRIDVDQLSHDGPRGSREYLNEIEEDLEFIFRNNKPMGARLAYAIKEAFIKVST